jgi:hypothetical protein
VTTYESDWSLVELRPSHQEMLAHILDLTQRIAEELGTADEKRWTTNAQFISSALRMA